MSTKTNFKRIALVAVAALGLGVLSSVPSQAAISALTVTVVDGKSAAVGSASDSTNAATFNLTGFFGAGDSVTAYVVAKAAPSTAVVTPVMYNLDSATPLVASTVDSMSASGATAGAALKRLLLAGNNAAGVDTVVATYSTTIGGIRLGTANDANINHTFGLQLDSGLSTTRAAGTYTYTLVVKVYEAGSAVYPTTTITKDINIVIAAAATASTTASAITSTALLSTATTAGVWQATATDSTVAASAKTATNAVAAIKLDLLNAAGGTSPKDSVTVSIDKGNVSIGSSATGTAAQGKTLVPYSYSAATAYIHVYADGNSGTGTVTIKTLNAGTFTKTVTFVATTPASIVASLNKSVIGVGAESSSSSSVAIRAQMFDANASNFGALTAVYAYSSDTSVISNYGTVCTYGATSSSTLQYSQYCELTGVKAGTATITIRDASTVALSTVASNAVSVRVSTGVATSFTLTTDKASYAPGEKGYVIITVKDAAGLVMPSGSYTLASGGISTSANLGTATDLTVLNSTSVTTQRVSASATSPASTDPVGYVLFYAPATAGSFTFTATAGSVFPAAARVTAVTTTATVADSASAALAAVSALAVTVASLKTLITTLTNLVLKIQKKVKA